MSEAYDAIRAGLEEAIRHARGEDVPGTIVHRPAAIVRRCTGLAPERFAAAMGVSPDTLAAWEDGTEAPSGPAAKLLGLIADEPGLAEKLAAEAA